MKYIFLDIDGVLNNGTGPFLHEDKVKLLSEIIEETNAKIILVSSWKDGWYNDKSLCTARAKIIDSVFEKFGIFIYDKTEDNNSWQRGKGINEWVDKTVSENNGKSYCYEGCRPFGYMGISIIERYPRYLSCVV